MPRSVSCRPAWLRLPSSHLPRCRTFSTASRACGTDKAVFVCKERGMYVGRQEASLDERVADMRDNEVLIENVCVAANPKDWKGAALWTGIEGSDVSGRVLHVGSGVRHLQPGQRVCAFTPMRFWRKPTKYGTYQSHTVCPAHTVAALPDSLSFEDAATIPLAGLTAAVGLYRNLRLDPPSRDSPKPVHLERADKHAVPAQGREPVLVWGASSSVGSYVVQLARLSGPHPLGYHVVGIAGASAELAASLGADKLFDYRTGPSADNYHQLIESIVAYLKEDLGGERLERAYDAVSSYETVDAIATMMHRSGTAPRSRAEAEATRRQAESGEAKKQPKGGWVPGGKGIITTVLPTSQEELQDDLKPPLANPIIKRTMVGTSHAGLADFAREWLPRLVRWTSEGILRPNKVKVMPGGLDAVIEGMQMLKSGKVRGEKLVYRIAETT